MIQNEFQQFAVTAAVSLNSFIIINIKIYKNISYTYHTIINKLSSHGLLKFDLESNAYTVTALPTGIWVSHKDLLNRCSVQTVASKKCSYFHFLLFLSFLFLPMCGPSLHT